MMKAKWKRFDDQIQELGVTSWLEASVFHPSVYVSNPINSKDWGWDVFVGDYEVARGRAKTERLVKRAAKQELIKLFRKLGKALDYDVE